MCTNGSWKPQLSRGKTKKQVIRMVTSLAQATEMAMVKIKRQQDALKPKKKGSLIHIRNPIYSRTESLFETLDDTDTSTFTTLLPSGYHPGSNPFPTRHSDTVVNTLVCEATPEL